MKILFFAPHSAIWVHAFPEALVAEAAAQQGNEIIYVGCGGQLDSYCVAMSAFGVSYEASPSEKKQVCGLCKKNLEIIRKNFGFRGGDLSELVDSTDLSYADELVSLVTPENCLDLSVDEIDVGRIALYELLLHAKKSAIDFNSNEWERYQDSLKNTILVLRVMKKIFDETQPDRVVVYNALYSVNRIVCKLAELRGIPEYFLHAGENIANRLQTLMLDRGHNFSHYQYMRNKWVEISQNPCPENAMKAATDHFLEVIKGRSPLAYSSANGSEVDLRKFFRIEEDQKVICATMSSYDEMFAAETIGALPSDIKLLFPKQVDWIRALIQYVANRRDLNLIIRIHPREFPNKRDGVLSAHAKMLKSALSILPSNVSVNWPTDKVSLYDLANIVDVFANAWSTAGEEMVLLGIPVVLYSHELVMYTSDLNFVGTTEQEYFQQIELALKEGWSSERIRKAYRWSGMKLGYASLDISESFFTSENQKRSLIVRGINKLVRIVAPYQEQKNACKNRAPQLFSAKKIDQIFRDKLDSVLDVNEETVKTSLLEETVFLKIEVGRLVEGLYGLNTKPQQGSLMNNLLKFANS